MSPDPQIDLMSTVNGIIMLIRGWMIPIAILIIIYAGVLYETSSLKPELQGTAKTILWTTITGLAFLILYPTIIDLMVQGGLIAEIQVGP